MQRAALTAFEQIPTSCHRVIGSPDTWLAPTLGPRALPPSIQMPAPLYLVKHLREPVSAKTDEFFQQFWRTNLCCRFSCIALKNTNNSDSKPYMNTGGVHVGDPHKRLRLLWGEQNVVLGILMLVSWHTPGPQMSAIRETQTQLGRNCPSITVEEN